ncbi:MAG TPA: ribosome-inactivating family protein [Streptomyces sp.]
MTRRIPVWVALLAVLSTFFVVLSPAVAKADPTDARIDAVRWDVTYLTSNDPTLRAVAAKSYSEMLNSLRHLAGHRYLDQAWETTSRGNEVLEVQIVRDGAHTSSIYLWARSLYVIGFWARNGSHRFFNDASVNPAADIMQIPQPQRLPWTGNYAQTPGGSDRTYLTYGPQTLNEALHAIEQMGTSLSGTPQQRNTLGRHMVRLIQTIAEAARFAEIENRIEYLIRNGLGGETSTLGNDLVELENNWGAISAFIHGWINNAYADPIFLRRRWFNNLTQLLPVIQWVLIRHTNNAGGS